MMNMKYIYNIMYRSALALAAVLALASCIRDEIALCPPLHVNISVKDKNYFNIDGAERLGYEERLAEDLPFNRYVSTLYYILHDAATGAVVQEQTVQQVTSGDRTISVSFPDDLPFGSYIITVWGNLQSERPLGDNPTASDLHLYNAEGNDIYLQSDTLLYDEHTYDYTVELERVKGKLIVRAENLPDHIDFSTKDITDVFAYVTGSFTYGKEALVHTDTLWQEPNEILTKTLLCPSTDIDNSNLSINFYDYSAYRSLLRAANTHSWIAPEDIRISMRRNELTILRYIYERGGGDIPEPEPEPEPEPDPDDPDIPTPDPDIPEGNSKFKIYVLVNDNWEGLHNMEIN